MTSLVTELFVNPVIRQAHRFSRSIAITGSETQPAQKESRRNHDDAASETDRESLRLGDDDIEENTSTTPSSRTSIQLDPHGDATSHQCEWRRQSDQGELPNPRHPDFSSPELQSQARLAIREPEDVTREMEDESISLSPIDEGSNDVFQVVGPPFQSEAQKPEPLPEDDGMGLLRKRILSIQLRDIPPAEKARLMHNLFQEGHTNSGSIAQADRPSTPSCTDTSVWQRRLGQGPLESLRFWQNALLEGAAPEAFNLTEEDIKPTFATPIQGSDIPEDVHGENDDTGYRPFGCDHYRRNVKLQCSTCNRWYTCRFCHDQVEDHALVRKETKNMLCMLCGTAQRAGEFRNLDMAIHAQPMPPEFEDTRAVILCNDCSAKSSVKYHWLGLKCAVCLSYNTAQLQILGTAPDMDQAPASTLNLQPPEASITSTHGTVDLPEPPGGRDIPRRRRHSSNVARGTSTSTAEPDLSPQIPDRLSRSFSPTPNFGHAWNGPLEGAQVEAIDEEDEREDMIGIWSRLPRGLGSNEDEDDAADSEDDSEWSTEDEDMEGDEDDDDDDDDDFKDFSLLGHR
ncbi:hypothetical protein DL762_003116 [Monosporascus cannonballus]|uniref:CHY-type domain-containing protein n=1 Tax=Monosporascus cannonballus TaxID=155416 RepID=A0ABY0HBJ7_9PEZI|nr:hypothetical protein DL762_003116 [Monosporascus cannonballus]